MLERFQLEARAAAKLEHDNFVTVFAVGEIHDRPFYSMKYIPGLSLAGKLSSGPLSNRQSAIYMEQVTKGVSHAHELGVLHRDIKPQNVLVDQNDRALVTDFGLAKLLESDSEFTAAGEILGTPSYMSPEQARDSSRASVASDIYSIGATLYALLVGHPPFYAADRIETLRQVVESDPVPLRQINPAVDRDLETITLKCLAKTPHQRYRSTSELTSELQRYLDGKPIQARPLGVVRSSWRWAKRKPWVAAFWVILTSSLVSISVLSMWATFSISEKAREIGVKAEESLDRLVKLKVANGAKQLEQGNVLGALPWLTDTLEDFEQSPQVKVRYEMQNQIRLASILRKTPSLNRVILQPGVQGGEFSFDGNMILIAGSGEAEGALFKLDAEVPSPIILDNDERVLYWLSVNLIFLCASFGEKQFLI